MATNPPLPPGFQTAPPYTVVDQLPPGFSPVQEAPATPPSGFDSAPPQPATATLTKATGSEPQANLSLGSAQQGALTGEAPTPTAKYTTVTTLPPGFAPVQEETPSFTTVNKLPPGFAPVQSESDAPTAPAGPPPPTVPAGLHTPDGFKPGDELPEDDAGDATPNWDTPAQNAKAHAYNQQLDAWKADQAKGALSLGDANQGSLTAGATQQGQLTGPGGKPPAPTSAELAATSAELEQTRAQNAAVFAPIAQKRDAVNQQKTDLEAYAQNVLDPLKGKAAIAYARIERQQTDLAQQSKDLDAADATLDKTSQSQIDAYNAKVTAYQSAQANLTKDFDAYKQQFEAPLNAASATYNQRNAALKTATASVNAAIGDYKTKYDDPFSAKVNAYNAALPPAFVGPIVGPPPVKGMGYGKYGGQPPGPPKGPLPTALAPTPAGMNTVTSLITGEAKNIPKPGILSDRLFGGVIGATQGVEGLAAPVEAAFKDMSGPRPVGMGQPQGGEPALTDALIKDADESVRMLPIIGGIPKILSGLKALKDPSLALLSDMGRAAGQEGTIHPGEAPPALTRALTLKAAAAADDVITGAFDAAQPFLAEQFLKKPISFLYDAGKYMLAREAIRQGMQAAGAAKEYVDLAGDAGAFLALGGSKVLEGKIDDWKATQSRVAEAGRSYEQRAQINDKVYGGKSQPIVVRGPVFEPSFDSVFAKKPAHELDFENIDFSDNGQPAPQKPGEPYYVGPADVEYIGSDRTGKAQFRAVDPQGNPIFTGNPAQLNQWGHDNRIDVRLDAAKEGPDAPLTQSFVLAGGRPVTLAAADQGFRVADSRGNTIFEGDKPTVNDWLQKFGAKDRWPSAPAPGAGTPDPYDSVKAGKPAGLKLGDGTQATLRYSDADQQFQVADAQGNVMHAGDRAIVDQWLDEKGAQPVVSSDAAMAAAGRPPRTPLQQGVRLQRQPDGTYNVVSPYGKNLGNIPKPANSLGGYNSERGALSTIPRDETAGEPKAGRFFGAGGADRIAGRPDFMDAGESDRTSPLDLDSTPIDTFVKAVAQRYRDIRSMEDHLDSGEDVEMHERTMESSTPEQRRTELMNNVAAHRAIYEEEWDGLRKEIGPEPADALRDYVEQYAAHAEAGRAEDSAQEQAPPVSPQAIAKVHALEARIGERPSILQVQVEVNNRDLSGATQFPAPPTRLSFQNAQRVLAAAYPPAAANEATPAETPASEPEQPTFEETFKALRQQVTEAQTPEEREYYQDQLTYFIHAAQQAATADYGQHGLVDYMGLAAKAAGKAVEPGNPNAKPYEPPTAKQLRLIQAMHPGISAEDAERVWNGDRLKLAELARQAGGKPVLQPWQANAASPGESTGGGVRAQMDAIAAKLRAHATGEHVLGRDLDHAAILDQPAYRSKGDLDVLLDQAVDLKELDEDYWKTTVWPALQAALSKETVASGKRALRIIDAALDTRVAHHAAVFGLSLQDAREHIYARPIGDGSLTIAERRAIEPIVGENPTTQLFMTFGELRHRAASRAAFQKEPWERTKAESDALLNDLEARKPDRGKGETSADFTARSNKWAAENKYPERAEEYSDHKALVEKALSEGKPVAPEVLADYPDLKANTPSEQTGPGTQQPRALPVSYDTGQTHDYSSTQANLPDGIAGQVRAFAEKIPDSQLSSKSGEGEETPHVTIKYGNPGVDPAPIQKALAGKGPLTVKLADTATVFHTDDGDVLKVAVESIDGGKPTELHYLNGAVGAAVEHTGETFPDYKPHVTIAYLRKGEGAQYDGQDIPGVTGQTVTLHSVTFSGKDGKQTEIPLTGANSTGAPSIGTPQPQAETGTPGSTESTSPLPDNIQHGTPVVYDLGDGVKHYGRFNGHSTENGKPIVKITGQGGGMAYVPTHPPIWSHSHPHHKGVQLNPMPDPNPITPQQKVKADRFKQRMAEYARIASKESATTPPSSSPAKTPSTNPATESSS